MVGQHIPYQSQDAKGAWKIEGKTRKMREQHCNKGGEKKNRYRMKGNMTCFMKIIHLKSEWYSWSRKNKEETCILGAFLS